MKNRLGSKNTILLATQLLSFGDKMNLTHKVQIGLTIYSIIYLKLINFMVKIV